MQIFRFYHPIEIRYSDLDPQGHVNNARYLSFMEQARLAYVRELDIWEGGSFLDLGIILANAEITFKAPMFWGQPVRVGVRIARLGAKSMDSLYRIEHAQTGLLFAGGSSVLVTYDYHQSKTIPIPDSWRQVIMNFEDLPSNAPSDSGEKPWR